MRSNFFFLFILLLIVSCISPQKIEVNQISKPKHNIYGNWKNEFEDKRFSDFKISIAENNTIVIEQTIPNRNSEFINSRLELIDEQTAVFFYTIMANQDKISVKINIKDKNSLGFNCFLTDHPELKVMLDPPILCFTHDFVRVNNEL